MNVVRGSRWIHKNGHMKYTVLFLTNEKTTDIDKHPIVVVYLGDNGNIWSRNLNTWHESMTMVEKPYKGAINQPCSACSAGDTEMKYHDHDYVDIKNRVIEINKEQK